MAGNIVGLSQCIARKAFTDVKTRIHVNWQKAGVTAVGWLADGIVVAPEHPVCRTRTGPKVFLNEAKQKIMDELKAQGSSEYVGSSDVLMAWWYKTVYSYRAPTDHTPVHLHFVSNLRSQSVFAQDEPLAHPYTNNAILYLHVPPIPVNAFVKESLGDLALHIRRAIVAHNADAASLRADLHWLFEGSNAAKMMFPCPPGAEFSFATNWRDGKLGALDFSGAVVSQSKSEAAATRVVFTYFFFTPDSFLARGSGAVMMEDEDAVWMHMFRGSKDWERIRQSGVVDRRPSVVSKL
ncbi:hypothetical protein MSAN_00580200 [Mycena sanguinolenta]|uniref:Uncharacterized protein n=1 Tax=Mycena sanguinolenta TaxID=230812 RepID=A0A8H7DHT3_9AGAR|nr:hypothetical protein MSAN_00580200 [Mycena sanguinolenta]